MGCKTSSTSDILGTGRKNRKIIIIILIFVLFFCGCNQGGSCFPVDPCCRRRRRRSGFRGSSLLPILVVLAVVFGLGNKGNNTNIVKVNTDPSAVRGESADYSYCDY